MQGGISIDTFNIDEMFDENVLLAFHYPYCQVRIHEWWMMKLWNVEMKLVFNEKIYL